MKRSNSRKRRLRKPRLEKLEDRRLLAGINIEWTNRNDSEFDIFGTELTFDTTGDSNPDTSRAEMARRVVDQALHDWSVVFNDWAEYGDDTFEVEINMGAPNALLHILPDAVNSGCSAFALPDNVIPTLFGPNPFDTLTLTGVPNQGRIYVGLCEDTNGWFIDSSPWEHSEFLGAINNAFSGDATDSDSDADDLRDLYTTIVHEMTHVLGMLPTVDGLLGPIFQLEAFPNFVQPYQWDYEVGGLLEKTNPVLDDVVYNAGELWKFNTALFTSGNGVPSLSPIHLADPDTNHEQAGHVGSEGANPGNFNGTRNTPSFLIAEVLGDIYSHGVNTLDVFSPFYIAMQKPFQNQPGTLIVRGGGQADHYHNYDDTADSDDTITLSSDGTNVLVANHIGTAVKGTLTGGATYKKTIPHSDIDALRLLGFDRPDSSVVNDGDDTFTLDFSTSDWLPSGPSFIDGGKGVNTLNIIGAPGGNTFVVTTDEIIVNGKVIAYDNVEELTITLGTGGSANSIDVFGTSGVDLLTILGDSDRDSINVDATGAELVIDGKQGDDIIVLSPYNRRLGFITNPAPVTVDGGGGDDLMILNDSDSNFVNTYTIDADFNQFPGGVGVISMNYGPTIRHQTIDSTLIFGTANNDTFLVRGTAIGQDITLLGQDGDDVFEVASDDLGPNVNKVHSKVTVIGGDGDNTAMLNDLADNSPIVDRVTITDSTVGATTNDTYFGLEGSFEYHGLSELTVQVGPEDNPIFIEGTAEGTETNVLAGRGFDAIQVTAPADPGDPGIDPRDKIPGTVDHIKSRLFIDGEKPGASLVVINTTDTTTDKMTVTNNTIGVASFYDPNPDSFLGAIGAGIYYQAIDNLAILMGSGGNEVYVRSTAPPTLIETGSGDDTVTVRDGSGQVDQIRSLLAIDGKDGHDVVEVDDAGENDASQLRITSSELSGDGTYFGIHGEMSYGNLEQLRAQTGQAVDFVQVNSTAIGTETTVATGPANDQIAVSNAGLTNLIQSHLIVDGEADNAVLAVVNSNSLTQGSLTISKDAIAGDGSYFGVGGKLSYMNLQNVGIVAGQNRDLVRFESTHPASTYFVDSREDNDIFVFDSNSGGNGGHLNEIKSQIKLNGGSAGENNVILLNDRDDTTGDKLEITPTAPGRGKIDGTFLGEGGFHGSINYDKILGVAAVAGQAADNFYLTPDVAGGAQMIILGGDPDALASPADEIHIDLGGTADAEMTVTTTGGGTLDTSTHERITFGQMELLRDPSGTGYDLIVDNNSAGLGGNDGTHDVLEMSSGLAGTEKTLELVHNQVGVFAGFDADIHRMLIKGSTDDDTFVFLETSNGLPSFSGDLSGGPGHTNAAFATSGLQPQNIGIHFDGGAAPGIDSIKGDFINPHNLSEFQDNVQPANSGVLNIENQFSMSYESLEPITWLAAGGHLNVDATLLSQMTWMTQTNLGGNGFVVDGDGGFERTTFSGYDTFEVSPPSHITLQTELTVNSTGDGSDAVPGDGLCATAAGDGECTLRAAIEETNAGPAEQIVFDISGDGPHRIQPRTGLPAITSPVIVDGYSQPGASENTNPAPDGSNAVLQVEINGDLISDGSSGLVVRGRDSRIRGLAINGFGHPGAADDPTVAGLVLGGSGRHRVEGNFIGTDASGQEAVGNLFGGIHVASAKNTIGGSDPAARNVISGNLGTGIHLSGRRAVNNIVQGNLIGTDAAGTGELPNTMAGVSISSSAQRNSIGGTSPATQNVIAFNGAAGVEILDGTGNRVLVNSLHSNGGLGIELANDRGTPDGVTPNDPRPDADAGPNQLQNFPELRTASVFGNQLQVAGQMLSAANTRFDIRIFANQQADPSGHGEGQRYLGSTSVTTNDKGAARWSTILSAKADFGEFITATATDPAGNTSEFSGVVELQTGMQMSDDTWLIRGTEFDDTIQIMSRGNQFLAAASFIPPDVWVPVPAKTTRAIQVESGAGRDQVTTRFASHVPEVLEVRTGAGDDRIELVEQLAKPRRLQTPFHVKVETGAGNDIVRADMSSHVTARDLVFAMGDGDDELTITEALGAGVNEQALYEIAANMGSGNDKLTLGQQVGFDPQPEPPAKVLVNINSGAGQDQTTIGIDGGGTQAPGLVHLNAKVHVDTGSDTDQVHLRNSRVTFAGFESNVDLGADDDLLVVSEREAYYYPPDPVAPGNIPVAMSQVVHGGLGNDSLQWELRNSMSKGVVQREIDAGAGNDRVLMRTTRNVDHIVAQQIDGGDGNDVIRVFDRLSNVQSRNGVGASASLNFLGGNGNDTIVVDYYAPNIDGDLSLTVNAGEGRDTVRVEMEGGSVAGDETIDLIGGGGSDSIDYRAVAWMLFGDGSLGVAGGRGSDNVGVTLDGYRVDGGNYKADIDTGAGNDVGSLVVGFDPSSHGTFRGLVSGDLGDDQLTFVTRSLAGLDVREALLDGGDGTDACRASDLVTVINCER